MGEVISFRLNPNNPREAKALEILRTEQAEGFSSRRVLSGTSIGLVDEKGQVISFPITEFHTALKQVSRLLNRLNSIEHEYSQSTCP